MQRLPNKIIYPLLGWQAFVVIITFLITGDPSSGWRDVGGALIGFTGFELLRLFGRGALGVGDVKLPARLLGLG